MVMLPSLNVQFIETKQKQVHIVMIFREILRYMSCFLQYLGGQFRLWVNAQKCIP